jgi:hypothetical protein
MSSVVNIAAIAVASNQAQVQMAVAAKLAKMNTDNAQSVVQLIESANASLQQLVQSPASTGVGATLDISA